jgi:hypothetical protein
MTSPKPRKSPGQVLFEVSPNAGWEESWDHLGEAQQQWWEAFSKVAKSYIEMQSPGNSESTDEIFEILEQSSPDSRGSGTP